MLLLEYYYNYNYYNNQLQAQVLCTEREVDCVHHPHIPNSSLQHTSTHYNTPIYPPLPGDATLVDAPKDFSHADGKAKNHFEYFWMRARAVIIFLTL